jgi:hypothetical protein
MRSHADGQMKLAVLAILAIGFGGCVLEGADDDVASEPVERVSGSLVGCDPAVYEGCWDHINTSKVTTRVYVCKRTAVAASSARAQCPVEPDFVLVGGGAEIIGAPEPAGLLTSSYPFNSTTWWAQSNSVQSGSLHKLRAYAIGLKLDGLSRAMVEAAIRRRSVNSTDSQAPSASLTVPAGHLLLSGGARTHDIARHFLTASYPVDTVTWKASAKDHNVPFVSYIETHTISIAACPSLRVNYCLTSHHLSGDSPVGDSYETATVASALPVVGVGAYSLSVEPAVGRLLTDMFPITGSSHGASATGKAELYSNPGKTRVHLINLASVPKPGQ